MTPPAFDQQGIGEAPPVVFDPSKVSVSLKLVLGGLLALGGLIGPTTGFIWAIYQRDVTFRETVKDVVQDTKEELTAAVTKLDTRQAVTDSRLVSIETFVKSIDTKLEVQAELRARMNANDERMNRIERALERNGRTGATAHLPPNEG